MANSKYEGGSKVTTFRLPVKWFEEAKKTIDNYLKRFEGKPGLDRKIGYPVTPQEAIKAESRIDEAVQNYAENLRPTKKVVPKDLVEKLKELDPKIVVPKKFTYSPENVEPVFDLSIKGVIRYPCGCLRDDVLFRRADGCKISIEDHNI